MTEHTDNTLSVDIAEYFYSIQGESLYVGRPCIFIRLSECNLRCRYCDTQYAWGKGSKMSFREILEKIKVFPCRLVEITGGEPLIQPQTPDLITFLIENGYDLLLETNGSRDLSNIPSQCVKIVDIKCPSSGEHKSFLDNNLTFLNVSDQVKFVIGTEADFTFALSKIKQIPLRIPRHHILFAPVEGQMSPEQLSSLILKNGLGITMQIQLHKIIWPHFERGV